MSLKLNTNTDSEYWKLIDLSEVQLFEVTDNNLVNVVNKKSI